MSGHDTDWWLASHLHEQAVHRIHAPHAVRAQTSPECAAFGCTEPAEDASTRYCPTHHELRLNHAMDFDQFGTWA